MSTQRINSSPEKRGAAQAQHMKADKDIGYNHNNSDDSPQTGVPTHVIYKLLGFTFAMVVGPISCYFLTLHRIFAGNSTYAGATAAIVANLVLAGYVIVAFREDQGEVSEGKKEKKTN